MSHKPTIDHDRRRRRALLVFQVLIYGYLIGAFLVQMHMYSQRDW